MSSSEELRDGMGEAAMDELSDGDFDWEDGENNTAAGEHPEEPKSWDGQVTVTMAKDLAPGPKSKPKNPQLRRATAKDKEFSLLVHKTHLLCLLARGRIVDAACSDPLLQASLLSLVPGYFSPVTAPDQMSSEKLLPIVRWFQCNFRLLPAVKSSTAIAKLESDKPFASRLADVLAERAGTAEEIAALAVAVFRCLGFITRFVSVLDVASLKPDSESLDASQEWESTKDMIEGFQLGMNHRYSEAASLSRALAGSYPQNAENRNSKSAGKEVLPDRKLSGKSPQNSRKRCTAQAQDLGGKSIRFDEGAGQTSFQSKADREFELQLAMAISATAAVGSAQAPVPSGETSSQPISRGEAGDASVHAVKLSSGRKVGSTLLFRKRKKEAELETGTSGSLWSRKRGPLLHWAEVFCCNDTATGKWVHVDAGNGIVDGVDKVEGASVACRLPLRYVVAFAGSGAKDVTRRYSPLWSRISSLRVDEEWWDATLRPLKLLEASATSSVKFDDKQDVVNSGRASVLGPNSGTDPQSVFSQSQDQAHCADPIDRSAWEDIELESRVLKEPLPANQQAYKNHHLYVLEKWLTKYQALYPKGPVLGYCAGQPVYPRSCVQNLHTAEHWLREGRKVIPGEEPYKVVKKSRLAGKDTDGEGRDAEGVLPTSDIFGRWQTREWRPPPAVNGIVPKNERGQVDVWSEKCLPPGTVHLRYPRLVPIARTLGVDYAPAFVGFEVQRGQALPKFEGIVVCKEFETAILDAYWHEESSRAESLRRRREEQALVRWWQLLRSVTSRERLRHQYENGHDAPDHQASEPDCRLVPEPTEALRDGTPKSCQATAEDSRRSSSPRYRKREKSVAQELHIHQFLEADGDSSSCRKWCSCGVSMEIEEI